MNLVDLFIQMAKTAGVEAETVSASELRKRLKAAFLDFGPVATADFSGDVELADSIATALNDSGVAVAGKDDIERARLGVTSAAALIADTGSQVVHSGQAGAMKASLLPPIHLALAREGDIFEDMPSFLARISPKLPSRMVFITGPSRTGDIEATMTTGVHGPGRSLVWIIV